MLQYFAWLFWAQHRDVQRTDKMKVLDYKGKETKRSAREFHGHRGPNLRLRIFLFVPFLAHYPPTIKRWLNFPLPF